MPSVKKKIPRKFNISNIYANMTDTEWNVYTQNSNVKLLASVYTSN